MRGRGGEGGEKSEGEGRRRSRELFRSAALDFPQKRKDARTEAARDLDILIPTLSALEIQVYQSKPIPMEMSPGVLLFLSCALLQPVSTTRHSLTLLSVHAFSGLAPLFLAADPSKSTK